MALHHRPHFSNRGSSCWPRIANDVFNSTNVSLDFVNLPFIESQFSGRDIPKVARGKIRTYHAHSRLPHRSQALCCLASFSRRCTTGCSYPHHHPSRASRVGFLMYRTIQTNTRNMFVSGDAASGSLCYIQPQSCQNSVLTSANRKSRALTHFSKSLASETCSSRYSVPSTHITFNCHPSRSS